MGRVAVRAVEEQFCGLESYMREWEESGLQAMQQHPKYWLRFYTIKSIALVGVSCVAVGLAVALATRK